MYIYDTNTNITLEQSFVQLFRPQLNSSLPSTSVLHIMASSSTHESPEAEFSHLDDTEEFMVTYAEKVDEMLEQQAAPRVPSAETAVASASSRVDYER